MVATDFYAQEQVVLDSGPLRSAVAASMALPALFTPVTVDGRVLMDGGLVNPLPFDVLQGRGRHRGRHRRQRRLAGPGKRPQPTAFSALVSSSQILQRSIVREKLKAQQPDIYIDVEVDEFHVLEFHRFKQMLRAAEPAKDAAASRQLAARAGEPDRRDAAGRRRAAPSRPPSRRRKRRLPGLKQLARRRRA